MNDNCHSQHRVRKFVNRHKGKLLLGGIAGYVILNQRSDIRELEGKLSETDSSDMTVVVVD